MSFANRAAAILCSVGAYAVLANDVVLEEEAAAAAWAVPGSFFSRIAAAGHAIQGSLPDKLERLAWRNDLKWAQSSERLWLVLRRVRRTRVPGTTIGCLDEQGPFPDWMNPHSSSALSWL